MMSRALSRGRMCFEQANIALEDLILAELGGKICSIDPILVALDSSHAHISDMVNHVDLLRHEMNQRNYVDLPTLLTTNLTDLGDALTDEGIIDSKARWQEVQEKMENGGFVAVLNMIERNARDIKHETELLRRVIAACALSASSGKVAMILEENSRGNFRADFAKMYSNWNVFMGRFLASSMLSTELWYRFNRYGSLVSAPSIAARAARFLFAFTRYRSAHMLRSGFSFSIMILYAKKSLKKYIHCSCDTSRRSARRYLFCS
ncbi:MAG: hypothetical protein AAB444_00445 [Patescibacteria group bacterium]